MINEKEKKVIALIQGDIPIEQRPYQTLAKKAGMEEDEFISVLEDIRDRGIIRRYGATLRHQKSGFSTNAMVAWQVPEERIEDVGKKMAEFDFVSHCYRRDPQVDWPFNLYTMIHAKSDEDCEGKVKSMSEKSGVEDFSVLQSEKELKKISMEYFSEEI